LAEEPLAWASLVSHYKTYTIDPSSPTLLEPTEAELTLTAAGRKKPQPKKEQKSEPEEFCDMTTPLLNVTGAYPIPSLPGTYWYTLSQGSMYSHSVQLVSDFLQFSTLFELR
jgi:hypothetical protein